MFDCCVCYCEVHIVALLLLSENKDMAGKIVSGMVPGMPGRPEEPGPNPQSCDTDCSQSRGSDHQGCLGHFQEGQEGHFQVLGAQ